jgi:hypothetical protein
VAASRRKQPIIWPKEKKGQKDNQWSTRHNTESWRLNNANTAMAEWLKTNNDLQNTAQQPED